MIILLCAVKLWWQGGDCSAAIFPKSLMFFYLEIMHEFLDQYTRHSSTFFKIQYAGSLYKYYLLMRHLPSKNMVVHILHVTVLLLWHNVRVHHTLLTLSATWNMCYLQLCDTSKGFHRQPYLYSMYFCTSVFEYDQILFTYHGIVWFFCYDGATLCFYVEC
jgi:hypothetical protein